MVIKELACTASSSVPLVSPGRKLYIQALLIKRPAAGRAKQTRWLVYDDEPG